jgi:hypothetical protein
MDTYRSSWRVEYVMFYRGEALPRPEMLERTTQLLTMVGYEYLSRKKKRKNKRKGEKRKEKSNIVCCNARLRKLEWIFPIASSPAQLTMRASHNVTRHTSKGLATGSRLTDLPGWGITGRCKGEKGRRAREANAAASEVTNTRKCCALVAPQRSRGEARRVRC